MKRSTSVSTIRGVLATALDGIIGAGSKELGETLADRVRYFRWLSAVSILEKAKKFAKEKQIKPRSIPIGFIVPFVEQASLVEEDSELSDMWANLLVSALSEYSAEMVAYTKILSELTPRGAKILSYLMNQEKGRRSLLVHPEGTWVRDIDQAIRDAIDPADLDSAGKRVFDALTLNGFSLIGFSLETEEGMQSFASKFETKVITNDGYNSLDLLKRQGLIEILRVDWTEADGFAYTATAALVTSLGLSFYSHCSGLEESWQPDKKKIATKSRARKESAQKPNRNETAGKSSVPKKRARSAKS